MITPILQLKLIEGHELSYQDLDEDVVITLTAKNSQAPQNIIRFDHTTGEFATVKLAESMIDHLEIESTSIHRDSEEGQKQLNSGKEEKGKWKKFW